jgi:hypothetical protein
MSASTYVFRKSTVCINERPVALVGLFNQISCIVSVLLQLTETKYTIKNH